MHDEAEHREWARSAFDADGGGDWFLAELVRRANGGGFSLDVTLCVGGTLVSGSLIGGRDFFESFADDMASAAGHPDVARRAREFFRRPAAMYAPDGTPGDPDGAPDPISYVHLRNARFFTTTGDLIPGNHGGYWRGKLSAVDGFVLGLLEPA